MKGKFTQSWQFVFYRKRFITSRKDYNVYEITIYISIMIKLPL